MNEYTKKEPIIGKPTHREYSVADLDDEKAPSKNHIDFIKSYNQQLDKDHS